MRVSVIIPAYNCEETIRETLDSVLRQTVTPHEVLVLDDGSTDGTGCILNEYTSRLTVFRQPNGGVGSALNALCSRAQGDVVAVLGSDDIWHPMYLEIQHNLIQECPSAVAYFTGHVNFKGTREYEWNADPLAVPARTRLIPPAVFLKEYNAAPGPFASMSHCCVPTNVLRKLGDQPFQLRAAEDLYFFNRLALLGPVLYASMPLVAYRIRSGSLSSDRLFLTESEVRAFELLEEHYKDVADRGLSRVFRRAFAGKRRLYGKTLMGACRASTARRQFARSLGSCGSPDSLAKSLALLLLTYMPAGLQPEWPARGFDPRLNAGGGDC